jgi:hypothetical protein
VNFLGKQRGGGKRVAMLEDTGSFHGGLRLTNNGGSCERDHKNWDFCNLAQIVRVIKSNYSPKVVDNS